MRRRTPFVWLADQPVHHSAGFATLHGGTLRREVEGTNRWVLARGRFTADLGDAPAELAITVDGRYRLWLNGSPLGRGPVRSSPHFQRYDRYAIAPQAGANVFAVLVHVPGVDLAWYETVKGAWQPVFGDGGLFAELEVNGAPTIIDWRLCEAEAWRRGTARAGWGQDFIEDFDARRLDQAWIGLGFDDSDWPAAREMVSVDDADQAARGFGRVEPFPALIASQIPHPVEREIAPARLLWTRSVEPAPEAPLEQRLYTERLGGDASELIDGPEALLEQDDRPTIVRTSDGRDTALMLAFDTYHAGRPFIELEARGGEIIEIATAESLPGEFGAGVAGDGLRQKDHLGVSHLFRYTARPGRQRFSKFNWAPVRAMQVVVRNAPRGVAVGRIGSLATHYPAEAAGAFECSDPLLTRLWEIGRHTVLQCMHDSWIDCPGREARQWVGDAVVQFDIAALAFGPSIHPLQRQFLEHAAEGQRADGLVRMFAPGDIAPDALVIPDFSLLWIIGAERYYRLSGDLETIDRILSGIERALHWFERHLGSNGLLADVPHWHFIEWANLDRRGEAAAINALYAGALGATVSLADATGRTALGQRCHFLRERVKAALNARHWDRQRGVYVDSCDPESGRQGRRVSQHSNALMLLFDLAPPERCASLLSAITDSERLKLTAAPPIVPHGEPFNAETDIVRANTFFSHFVYEGIARAGGFGWVIGNIRAAYGPMLATATTTLWESFTPNASLCHGFSATPVFQLSRHGLGIIPLAPGYRRFLVDPEPADLSWASGAIPTQFGPIIVSWQCEGRQLRLTLDSPSACQAEVAECSNRRMVSRSVTSSTMRLVFEWA